MRTNFVFIDFESVQPASLQALEAECFRVVVFVGANQAKIPFDVVQAMQRFGTRAEYIKISGNGPNALDFHIAFYVGRRAVQEPGAYFHIISRDTGFDPLIEHLRAQKIYAARWPLIDDIPLLKAGQARSLPERAQRVVDALCQPKTALPRTVESLGNFINTVFQQQLDTAAIRAVIDELRHTGRIAVAADGKLSYVLTEGRAAHMAAVAASVTPQC